MTVPVSATPAPRRAFPHATYLIKELERAVRVRIDEIVQPLRLTATQYTALSVLSWHPGMSSAQLARRSFVSPQAANEMVSVLSRRGLIRRNVANEGGRARWIFLTALGERTVSRCDKLVDAVESQLFTGATRREAAQFRAMLRTCREAIRVGASPAKSAKRVVRHSRVRRATASTRS
jgi:DNA-binding MarR family transcriptional regulator